MSDLADRVALLWAVHHVSEIESPEQFAAGVARARRVFLKEMEAKPKAASTLKIVRLPERKPPEGEKHE